MQRFTAFDGATYNVRDDVVLFPAGWTERAEQLALAHWTHRVDPVVVHPWDDVPLTDDERALIQAKTTRENLNRALRFLLAGGKTLDDYGFATLDQVHGVAWTPDVAPDATLALVYDHYAPDQGMTPHRIVRPGPHRRCATPHELNDVLRDECRHKEDVLDHVCAAHDLGVTDRPGWRFNEARQIELRLTAHPLIDEKLWAPGGAWCLTRRFKRPVIVR